MRSRGIAPTLPGRPRVMVVAATVAATVAVAIPAGASQGGAPDRELRAPASIESEPSAPARPPTWDEALGEPAAPPPAAPPPVVAPIPTEPALARPQPPSAQALEELRRSGNGLLIAAGVTAAVGTLLNGLRVYVVTVPCQTEAQQGCSMGYFMSSPLVMGSNVASMVLAGVGGAQRGRHDGWVVPDRHRRRSPLALAVGIPMIFLGVSTSIVLRALWLSDYSSPDGPEVFDFARPSHAFAYFGGQQLSATAMATGLGLVTYQGAGARIRRANVVAGPWLGPSLTGLRVGGRF